MNKFTEKPIILSLCSGSGSWEQPYVDDGGYEVIPVTYPEYDVRLWPSAPEEEPRGNGEWIDIAQYKGRVKGILAAPDCTYFSVAGNAWKRSDEQIMGALSVVDACFRIAYALQPEFFALENPVGKLRKFIGPPVFKFDPFDFGDPYAKRTYLWGWFKEPTKNPCDPALINEFPTAYNHKGEKIKGEPMSGLYYKWVEEKGGDFTAPSNTDLKRKYRRSMTPQGFAKAFYEANR